MSLEHRWSKCIAMEGNYIEKKRGGSQPEIGLAGYSLTHSRNNRAYLVNVVREFDLFYFKVFNVV